MTADGALPNLVVIGAMKCATTSLHYYLGLHPEIGMSRQKELEFFVEERNWGKGVRWYRSWFSPEDPVRGEASPQYTSYPKFRGVAERMHSVIPGAKLIYLVRDPVDRLLSHYVHSVAENRESRPLSKALHDPERGYLDRSRYYMQLENFLPYYAESDLLVVSQEELRGDRRATLRRVFGFLGVDPDFDDPRLRWELHRTTRKRRKTRLGLRLRDTAPMRLLRRVPARYRWPLEDLIYWPFSRSVDRPELSPRLRSEIEVSLRADVRRFREFTGRSFPSWSL